jgi:PAS domain S-box-containing protein
LPVAVTSLGRNVTADASGGGVIAGEGLGSVLDVVVEACVIMGFDGRIVGVNRAAERMFGWSSTEAAGAEIGELLFSDEPATAVRAMLEAAVAGAKRSLLGSRVELVAVRRDGHEVPIELTVSVVESESRPQLAALMLDISERKMAEARSRRNETVISSSGDAIWSGSLDGTIESWNPAAERLYGYSESEIVGQSAALLRPPSDLDEFTREQWEVGAGGSVLLGVLGQRKDGTLVDVAITLSPLCDEAGRVTGIVSVVRDVSEHNRTAARLTEALSRFAGAFEAASTGMALIGSTGRFLAVNPAVCALLARDADMLLASSVGQVIHPEDLAASRELSERAMTGEIDSCQEAKRFLLPDGGIVWGLLTVSMVRDAGGVLLHFVAQIQDITDRKTAEGEMGRYAAQLEALSGQDPLTGLPNRRAFHAAVEDELRVFALGGDPCSVLLARVDGDDAVIAAAAEGLTRASRGADVVAYLGHGELAVLLPSVDTPGARAIVERIRAALAPRHVHSSHATVRAGENVDGLLDRVRVALPDRHGSQATRAARTETGIARLLELARGLLEMPVSFLSRLDGQSYVIAQLTGSREQLGVAEGDATPLGLTHCQRMLDGRIGSTVADLATDPETRELDLTRTLGLRAYAGVPVRLRSGEIYGTLCAIDTRVHPELSERHGLLLGFLSDLAAELIEDETEQQAVRRVQASTTGVRTLLVALEARDFYTSEHSKQVVELASGVARRLGLSPDSTRDVEQVALLHDIGKVGIPDAVLQKQGPLDTQDWQLMRQHPVVGEHIIAGTPGLSHLAPAMRAEHEHWDGGGYPDGLTGEEIPLASRITLACDALNAMTNDRPYRPAMTLELAEQELRAGAGTQFGPRVTDALLAEIRNPTPPLTAGQSTVAQPLFDRATR